MNINAASLLAGAQSAAVEAWAQLAQVSSSRALLACTPFITRSSKCGRLSDSAQFEMLFGTSMQPPS
jgi:hypothetical protein